MDDNVIRGAGGGKGGGSGKGATEAPNTLQSTARAKLIDLLCEGPILGLVEEIDSAHGEKSIIINEVPVMNGDTSLNYQGYSYKLKTGESDQASVAGYEAIASEFAVSRRVRNATPVVYTTAGTDLTSIVVTLLIPALTKQDKNNGNLGGYNTGIAIDIKNNSNPFNAWLTPVYSDYISGKCTSEYERSYRIELPTPGQYLVRMRRLSPDSDGDASVNDKTFFSHITEIIDHRMMYSDSAYIAQEVGAEQFGGNVGGRKYDIYAMLMEYPSNYNPATRTYTGFWDGTFSYGYCNNPAWFFRVVATNPRYGAGLYNDAVEKWHLYIIAKYCDEMVPDGFGGTEPRFVFNGVIYQQQDAYKLLQLIASLMRCLLFYGAGVLMLRQDAPMVPESKVYTRSNIVGSFQYSGTAKSVRHTAAKVSFTNKDIGYDIDYVMYENPEGILRYGYNPLNIATIGTDSPGQAYRWGKWAVLTELLQYDIVSFTAGPDAAMHLPGDIIEIADPSWATYDFGGRVLSPATTGIMLSANQLILDGPIAMTGATHPAIHISMLDGPVDDVPGVDNTGRPLQRKITYFSATVTSFNPANNVVTLSSSITSSQYDGFTPLVWVFTKDELEVRPFKIILIRDNRGQGDGTTYSIEAIAYNADKFIDLDSPYSISATSAHQFTALPKVTFCPPPTNLKAVFFTQSTTTFKLSNIINASWDAAADQFLNGYSYTYKRDDENWAPTQFTFDTHVSIPDLPAGNYHFAVNAENKFGQLSTIVYATVVGSNSTFGGKTVITGLTTSIGGLTFTEANLRVTWPSLAPSLITNHTDIKAKWRRPDVGDIAGQVVIDVSSLSAPTITLSGTVVVGDNIEIRIGDTNAYYYTAASTSLTAFAEGIRAQIDADTKFTAVRASAVITLTFDDTVTNGTQVSANYDPLFAYFAVRIKNATTHAVVHNEFPTINSYTYTYEQNCSDFGGTGKRAVEVSIEAIDINGNASNALVATMTNAAPGAPTVAVTGVADGILVDVTATADIDYKGNKIYMSLTSGFTPGSGNLVYRGADTKVILQQLGAGAHYVRVRSYDSFDDDAGTLSTQQTATPVAVTALMAELDKIGEDGWLTGVEKQTAIKDYAEIGNTYTTLTSRATTLGILGSSEYTGFDTAVSNLTSYLGGITPAWNTTSSSSAITRGTWNSYWNAVYNTYDILLKKISTIDGSTAVWATVSGTGRPQDYATYGADASNLAVTLGAANLIRNSNGLLGGFGYGISAVNDTGVALTTSVGTGILGSNSFKFAWTSTAGVQIGFALTNSGGIDNSNLFKLNKFYVFSFEAKASGATAGHTLSIDSHPNGPDIVTALVNPALTSSYQRYVFRAKWTSTLGTYLRGYLTASAANGDMEFTNIKVEEGDFPTAYVAHTSEASWSTTYGAGKPQDNADVTAASQVVVSITTPVEYAANYLGVIPGTTANLVSPVSVRVSKGGTSIKLDDGTSYTITLSGGITGATIDNTNGSSTKGDISGITFSGNSGNIEAVVTVNGVAQPRVVFGFVKRLGDPPEPGGGSSTKLKTGTPGSLGTSDTSYVVLVPTMTLVIASGESLYGSGTLEYTISGTTGVTRTCTAKWQYAVAGSGSWNDFPSSPITGSTARADRYIPGDESWAGPEPGFIDMLQTKATPGVGSWDVRAIAFQSASGRTMTFTNTVNMEAKV